MDASANADQAESLAVLRGVASVGDSEMDEVISGQLEDEWSVHDEKAEALSGSTLEQLQARSMLLGAAYPFTIEGNAITHSQSATGVYEFLLKVSTADHSAAAQNTNLQVGFERLCSELVGLSVGTHLNYRTGWPTHDPVERPVRLAEVAKLLHEKTREWFWIPSPPNAEDPDAPKDLGLDFVVWRPLDRRPGSMFIVGQCACGKNWRDKWTELQPGPLGGYWSTTTLCPFTRAFCVPHSIPGVAVIGEITRAAGLVYDRTRLTLLAEHSPPDHPVRSKDWLPSLTTMKSEVREKPATKYPAARARPRKAAGAARRSR